MVRVVLVPGVGGEPLPGRHDQAPAQPEASERDQQHDHDGATHELADGELPTQQHDQTMPSSTTRFVDANMKTMAER